MEWVCFHRGNLFVQASGYPKLQPEFQVSVAGQCGIKTQFYTIKSIILYRPNHYFCAWLTQFERDHGWQALVFDSLAERVRIMYWDDFLREFAHCVMHIICEKSPIQATLDGITS
jgi:hypothetical protein